MAFANLFSSLSAVDEDVKRRGQPAFPPRYLVMEELAISIFVLMAATVSLLVLFYRNQSENGGRSNAQKRKGKQLGPHHKVGSVSPCLLHLKADMMHLVC